jgi:hexosaminidase
MLYPRLLAFAERAWHRAAWEPADGMDLSAPLDRAALDADWQRFANVVGHKELAKLDRAGVHYRVELPGARITGDLLEANAALPGLKLEYRTDGGEFAPYDPARPPAVSSTAVRAVTPSGRAGRAVDVSAKMTSSAFGQIVGKVLALQRTIERFAPGPQFALTRAASPNESASY